MRKAIGPIATPDFIVFADLPKVLFSYVYIFNIEELCFSLFVWELVVMLYSL